jgi:hypothetical protein
MKSFQSYTIQYFFQLSVLFLILTGCKKKPDGVIVLVTVPAFNISQTSIDTGGEISTNDDVDITAKGVCWGQNPNPTIEDSKTSDGTGKDNFTSEINGLLPNESYYARAYVRQGFNTTYGNQISFTTAPININPPCLPVKNTIKYNLITESFNYVSFGTLHASYGNYAMIGNASKADLKIEFIEKPKTGIYITREVSGFYNPSDCLIRATLSNFSYSSFNGDTLYIVENGDGKYSMTFCNVKLSSGSTPFDFYVDGNITSD